MKCVKRNIRKKGSIQDVPFLMGILFALGISIFVAFTIWGAINSSSLGESHADSREIKTIMTTGVMPTFDFWPLIVVVLGTIIAAILAFLIRTHPAFFPAAVMFLMIIVLVGHFISIAWDNFADADEFQEEVTQYPITNFILGNLATILTFIGAFILIATYAFNKMEIGI